MTDTRTDAWVYPDVETGMWVYRASSLGSCIRSLTAARLGESAFPFHAAIRASMDASSGLEEEAIRRFCIDKASSDVIWQQKRVELHSPEEVPVPGEDGEDEYFPHWTIRGHIDGMWQVDDSILEVKCLGQTNFEKYNSGGFDALGFLGRKYKWQAAVYGHATERKVRFVIGEKVKVGRAGPPGTADEFMTGRWDIDQLIIEPAVDPSSLVTLEEIHDKIRRIEDFASRDELPDCDTNCREGDPYGEVHLLAGPEKGDDRLESLVRRREELKELIGAEPDPKRNKPGWGLLGELAAVQDEIKTDYGHPTETQKYTVGPYTVSIIANRGRESIDTKWLRKNYPDVAAEATRLGEPFNTLIVKKSKRQEG